MTVGKNSVSLAADRWDGLQWCKVNGSRPARDGHRERDGPVASGYAEAEGDT